MCKYNGIETFAIPENAYGFVYLIEDLQTGMKYIGRKYLTASKIVSKRISKKDGTKTTKKRKTRVESNWKDYTGSCKPLNEEIKRKGKENFSFNILAFGFTKGQVNALEVICQIKANAIIDSMYYNDAVGSGMFRGVKFDDRIKDIIKGIII